MNVKGKIAIVTGASSGIGLATAKLLTKSGAKVALVARSSDKLEKISHNLSGSLPVTCDMTDQVQIKEMIKKVIKHFGKVDILINNAGQGYDASLEQIDINKFRGLFELDVIGPLVAMQEVIPLMKKQKEGVIVNISSGTALMHLPNMSAYSSLKRALVGISLTVREELKDDNISVSVIYPYITLTDFEKNTIREGKQNNFDEDRASLREFDTAEHVAEIILEGIKTGEAEIFAHTWMKNMS